VCERVLCNNVVCVCEDLCVCVCVCDNVVCMCVTMLCVCVRVVCVCGKEGRGADGGRTADGIQIKKQEPHTKMSRMIQWM
jgi:hypothetical protein